MDGNREGRDPAQRRIGQEGRGDQDAVGEVVEGIADQDQIATGAGFLVVMAVVVGV